MSSHDPAPPSLSGGAAQSQPTSAAPTGSDTSFSEALITLRKRWVLVFICVILGALYGFYKAVTQVKMYTAYSRIEVRSGSGNQFRLNSLSGVEDDASRNLSTQMSILTSDSLLTTVARQMNLANNKDFLGIKGAAPHANLDDPAVRLNVISNLANNLRVAQVPKTDILQINYSSLSPKLSADIVNQLVEDYQERSYQSRVASTQHITGWLNGQLDDLKNQVEKSEEQLLDLQKQLGSLGFDSTHNQTASTLDDLSRATSQATLARIVAESRYRQLAGMDPNSMEGSIDSTPGASTATLQGLRSSLETARAEYAQLTVTQGPNLPNVKALRARINELQREVTTEENRLLLQAKENFQIAKANEDQTAAALEAQKQAAYKMRDAQVELTLCTREFESSRTLYEGLLQKLKTAGVDAGLSSLEVDVVDPAIPPVYPILKPRSTLVMQFGALGLLLGVLLAFLLESLDNSLRSIAEIEAITQLPSLAIIPRARRVAPEQVASLSTAARNLGVLTQPKSQFAEAFRSLRTALLLAVTGHEPKYILFTSATPSEGKTTTAGNLAVILSQRGTKTLLIDADLRRPNVHHRFGLNGKVGLSTVLSGQTTLEDSVQKIADIPDLDVLASGPVPPFPTEMLSSEAMTALLRRAGELYSHVVIDSPPVLSVTDAVILSRMSDVVVLVVRHGKSSKQIVRRARDLLVRAGAPMGGIVLNAVDLNQPEYYGYYGYAGYSYSSLDPAGWEAKGSGDSKADGKRNEKRNS